MQRLAGKAGIAGGAPGGGRTFVQRGGLPFRSDLGGLIGRHRDATLILEPLENREGLEEAVSSLFRAGLAPRDLAQARQCPRPFALAPFGGRHLQGLVEQRPRRCRTIISKRGLRAVEQLHEVDLRRNRGAGKERAQQRPCASATGHHGWGEGGAAVSSCVTAAQADAA